MPLHAFAAWRASLLALAAAGGGDLLGRELQERIARSAVGDEAERALAGALLRETGRRWCGFWEGVARYRAHPYRRPAGARPTFWRAGETRVIDFAPDSDGPPVLATPSLVNSSDVLDLLPGRSLMAALAAAGFRPFLVDWGDPEPDAIAWSVDRYIADRLSPIADAIEAATGKPPLLLGYCMGGLLATALAAQRPDRTRGLALLATPWDFHAPSPEMARRVAGMADPFRKAAASDGTVPTDLLQVLFFSLDPTLAARKFRAFARQDQDSAGAELFVAMEDWVNGGPHLALPIAETVLVDWFGANATARGRWRVLGRTVDAAAYGGPTLVAAPTRDRIVPPESARAYAVAAPGADLLSVEGGHVGMISGRAAQRRLWTPLIQWLKVNATS